MHTQEEGVKEFFEKNKHYLYEFRRHAFASLVLFIGSSVVGMIFSQQILTWILHLFRFNKINLVMTSPYQFISLSFSTGILIGFVCTLPYLAYRFYIFMKPALKRSEIKIIESLFPLSIFLFVTGFIFGTWVMQFIINFYSDVSTQVSVGSLWDIQHFFSGILFTSVLTGIAFETPLIFTALIRLKIMEKKALVLNRRYVYAILLFVAVIYPSSTDAVTLIVTMIPLVLLFELSLILNKDQK